MIALTDFAVHQDEGSYSFNFTHSRSSTTTFCPLPSIASSTTSGTSSFRRRKPNWVVKSSRIRTVCEPSSMRASNVTGNSRSAPLVEHLHTRWGTFSGAIAPRGHAADASRTVSMTAVTVRDTGLLLQVGEVTNLSVSPPLPGESRTLESFGGIYAKGVRDEPKTAATGCMF